MIHGGDTLSYEKYYDGKMLDFSSNINPLGIPKGLEEELIRGFSTLTEYPDIKYRKLKESIKDYLNCEYENIAVGNGAMEIIDNFLMLSNRVITTTPAFAEYSLRAEVHKKEVIKIEYKDDFSLDIDKIEENLRAGDTLVLGNPNNPTGLRIPKETLLEIYMLVVERNAYLVLDEAFFEFAPKDYDSIELFKKYEYSNIGIIRAATKFFALPGIRLGYGCASRDMIKRIEEIQMPWTVNSLADIAGQYILNNKKYIEDSVEYIYKERNFLLGELKKYSFIEVYNTHTNYILIKLKDYNEDYIFDYFVRRGIVVRKCSSFKVLGKNHIRVAIKDRKANERLLEVFEEFEKEEVR